MSINENIKIAISQSLKNLFDLDIDADNILLQKTDPKFDGDLTLVVFPFLKASKKSPEETAKIIAEDVLKSCNEISDFNVVKGFLNFAVADASYLKNFLTDTNNNKISNETVVVEYSSPNTNKPLHLGHIRNNLLGWSVCEILKEAGYNVKKVNLVNDRGIHICKSMLAWQIFGKGETPQSSGLKGDHLVGKYYVIFDKEYKKQTKEIALSENISEEEAAKKAPILLEAQEMLRKWESGDEETIALWKQMNSWVYSGFDETYKRLGIDFDKIYYESETYLLGKEIVLKGLKNNILYKKEDNSIWADLREDGLDEKLLLRKDGTSVYMTQDLGTACLRMDDFNPEKLIYVVGNEQNYHFDVLKIVLKKLGYAWADNLVHLSYGMVELPEGKMKSREGTVVDADDLIDAMVETAKDTSKELGKITDFDSQESQKLFLDTALGALKYFILKVDPSKNMLFNPKDSIDFNGNTGPFIQYTHARISSLLNKADNFSDKIFSESIIISKKEKNILILLNDYDEILSLAAKTFSPAIIANYVYDLAKEYNSFYQDTPILREENAELRQFRLFLSKKVAEMLKRCLRLLGIYAPEKM